MKRECVNATIVSRVRAVVELTSVKHNALIGFVSIYILHPLATNTMGRGCMTYKNRNRDRDRITCKKIESKSIEV